MLPDISAVATTGGMLACFWAKLFSRSLVAPIHCRRFNPFMVRENRAGKRTKKPAQIGGFSRQEQCRVSRHITSLLEERP
jgi:hypothetical protein